MYFCKWGKGHGYGSDCMRDGEMKECWNERDNSVLDSSLVLAGQMDG